MGNWVGIGRYRKDKFVKEFLIQEDKNANVKELFHFSEREGSPYLGAIMFNVKGMR